LRFRKNKKIIKTKKGTDSGRVKKEVIPGMFEGGKKKKRWHGQTGNNFRRSRFHSVAKPAQSRIFHVPQFGEPATAGGGGIRASLCLVRGGPKRGGAQARTGGNGGE